MRRIFGLAAIFVAVTVGATLCLVALRQPNGTTGVTGIPDAGAQAHEVSAPAQPDTPPFELCYAFDHGSDLAVEFAGPGASADCQSAARTAAKDGSYWSVSNDPPTSVAPNQTAYCSMAAPGVALQAYVYDTGGAFGGQRVCANLVAHGWTDGQ